jgi:hypothetical protein
VINRLVLGLPHRWDRAHCSALAATELVDRLAKELRALDSKAETEAGHAIALEDELEELDEKKRRERAAAAVVLRELRENFGTMVERALPVGALATSKARKCLYTIQPKLEQITKAFAKECIDGHAQSDSTSTAADPLDFVVDSTRRLQP